MCALDDAHNMRSNVAIETERTAFDPPMKNNYRIYSLFSVRSMYYSDGLIIFSHQIKSNNGLLQQKMNYTLEIAKI